MGHLAPVLSLGAEGFLGPFLVGFLIFVGLINRAILVPDAPSGRGAYFGPNTEMVIVSDGGDFAPMVLMS